MLDTLTDGGRDEKRKLRLVGEFNDCMSASHGGRTGPYDTRLQSR